MEVLIIDQILKVVTQPNQGSYMHIYKIKKFYHVEILLAFIFVFISSQYSFGLQMIYSDFNTDDGGWSCNGGTITHINDLENSESFLSIQDTEDNNMFLIAPRKFIEYLNKFNYGIIAFDAKILINPNDTFPDFGKCTIYYNENETISIDIISEEQLSIWKTYYIPLNPIVWGKNKQDWLEILTNVTKLTISIEAGNRMSETMGFDNFRLIPVSDSSICNINDSDDDGVIDIWDKCFNFISYQYTDKNGCFAFSDTAENPNVYSSLEINQLLNKYTSQNEAQKITITNLENLLSVNQNKLLNATNIINEYSSTNNHLLSKIQEMQEIINFNKATITNLNSMIERQSFDIQEKSRNISELTNLMTNMYTEEDLNANIQTALASVQIYTGYTIKLSKGWHLLSSINVTTEPKTIPDDSIEIMYKYLNGSYTQINQVVPKYGYWIKVNKDCEFILEP